MNNIEQIIAALNDNPTPLIAWAAERIADLGSKQEWNMEDNFYTTETLVALAPQYGLPDAADQDDEAAEFYATAVAELAAES